MSRSVFLFLLLCSAVTSFAQSDQERFPLYHDSLRNDSYIRQVNLKLDSIKAFLRSDEVRFDMVKLNVAYTIRKSNGSHILQNPHSTQRFSAKDKKRRMTYCVASFEGKIVGISLNRSIFSPDSAYLETTPHIPVRISPVIYFDHDTLIYSSHSCYDPGQFVGSCGGASSEYENYFRNGDYYSTIISLEMYCGCGYNYIIADKTLLKLRKKLQKKWMKS